MTFARINTSRSRCSRHFASGFHRGRAAAHSTAADWLLLLLLWITGASGFLIEVALYLPPTPAWGYWVFLFHVAVAMELIILMPFTKFAHVIYRPVALFFLALARRPRPGREGA